MFIRTPKFHATSFKCQLRLAGRVQRQEIPKPNLQSVTAFRWQSATTVRINNDDEADQNAQSILKEPVNTDSRPSTHETGNIISEETDRSQQRTKFRRWRPHKAEGLGVDVLGKPAEVLILPERNRRATQVQREEVNTEERAELQRSLDSETKPISISEALQNIDSFKADAAKGRQVFSGAEWEDIKRRVAAGFTKLQLQEYLRLAAGKSTSDPPEEYLPTHTEKRHLAAQIMTKVWQWKSHGEEEVDVSKTPQSAKHEITKKKFVMVKGATLRYIMLYEKQQLRRISEDLDVQIDVFKKDGRIRLTGSESAVLNANKKLGRIVKSIRESTLEIPKDLQKNVLDNVKAETLLAMIMQKHKLLIRRADNSLKIVGLAGLKPDLVLRDLLLLSSDPAENRSFSFTSEQMREQATLVPFSPIEVTRELQDRSWSRYLLTTATAGLEDTRTDSGLREVRKAASKSLKADKPDQSKLALFSIAPGSLSHEYSTELGQALFDSPQSAELAAQFPSENSSDVVSAVVLQQALLPQSLARKDFMPVFPPENSEKGPRTEDARPFVLHLRLRPISPLPTCPPLEMYLSGSDIDLGLRQPLQVKEVFAILDKWQHSLLLPHLPLDIVMKRQSKIDLMAGGSATQSKAYLEILQQLGGCLESFQSSNQAHLPAVWRLDVTTLLSNKGKYSSLQRDISLLNSSTKPQVLKQDDVSSKASSDDRSLSTYILETPEYLDVASYNLPSAEDQFIDYILCETDSADRPRQRQILRISPRSLSTLSSDNVGDTQPDSTNVIEKQRAFRASISVAYELATKLGNTQKDQPRSLMHSHD